MTHKTVYKTTELRAAGDNAWEFVASDETIDRYGDIVRVKGWELANYKRNPIVLYQHQSSVPVGISDKVWIEGKALMSRIKLAAEGTSDFIDTLRKLLQQKIIRAVSVGFVPTKQPNYLRDEKSDSIVGQEFIGQELLEISLVSVPANPAALALAKSMDIPQRYIERIFVPETPAVLSPDALVKMAQNRTMLDIIKSRVPTHHRG